MAEISYGTTPFAEAISFLAGKINVDTDDWTDTWQEQHDTQFVVAGAKGAVLQDFREAIDRAIQQGMSLPEFLGEFDRIVATRGWDYRGGRNWRAATILGTNLRTAYAAGRYQQMTAPETLRRRPYWEWRHGDSRNPRPLHLALDGQVFPAGSDFWDSMFPPAGWGCRCKTFALSEGDLRRMGKDVPDEPPELGSSLEVTDPATGKKTEVRVQADAGWDYVPGQSNVETRRAAMLQRLDPELQERVRGGV